jgi:ABC-type lipoprotein release transport system permease subunit
VKAVWLRLRIEARSHWRSWLGVALLVGVTSGAGIAAFAGARRTQTAYDRFLGGTHAFDIALTNGSTPDTINRQFDFSEIAHLPDVADATKMAYYDTTGTTAAGKPITDSDISPFADPTGRFGTSLNGVRVLHGRMPTGPNEMAMTFLAADRLGVRAGQSIRLELAGPKALAGGGSAPTPIRVVGVVAMQGGFPPITGGLPPLAILSPAYARAHPDSFQVFAVRLRDGTRGIPAFNRELDQRAAVGQVVTSNQLELGSAVQRGLDVEATALRLLGFVVAAVTLLLLGQALVRLGFILSDEDDTLRGLGFTGAQLRMRALGRGLAIGVAAGAIATVTAVLLSALTPVGVARQAELHPGIAVNAGYIGLGVLGLFIAFAILSLIAGWWASRSSVATRRPPSHVAAGARVSGALESIGASTAMGTGVRMALEPGRGRSSVPVRSTIISAIVGIAVITGVLGFSASLTRLLHEPHLYGWNWDIQVGDLFAPDLRPEAVRLAHRPETDGVAVGTISRLRSGTTLFDTLAIESVKGTMTPTVVEGRAPTAPSEIMLGTRTLDDLGLHVGDTLRVSVGNRSAQLRIVGRGVLTEFAGAARLGEGATMTFDGIRTLVDKPVADVVLVRARPDPAGQKLIADLSHTKLGNVYLPDKPSDLVDLSRVGGLPSVIAALLAIMAIATLAHALFSSARRRRRELAILKVLGFRRRQVSAAIAWQAVVVAAIAVVVGVPLGIAAGRWGWEEFAQRLGVPDQPVTPYVAIAAVAGFALLVAIVTAAIPARIAARTRPGTALRAE